ncbi:hypothetical protein D9M68_873210 [compost metagenome]
MHVDEHRDCAALQDRIHRRGEARRHADHLVAGLDCAVAELGRCQGRERDQIGRRAGVHGHQVLHTQITRETAFEQRIEAPRREPCVERRIDHQLHFGRADDLARRRDHGFAGHEGRELTRQLAVLADQREDLLAQLVFLEGDFSHGWGLFRIVRFVQG